MIVAIKNRLALIIATALEAYGVNCIIIKNGFNEDTDNKPTMSKQITINHIDSTLTLKSPRDLSFYQENKFSVIVTVKDLRSDDPIQNIVNIISISLIGANFGGNPIKEVVIDNQGYSNGLWKYALNFTVTLNSSDDNDQCLLEGIDNFDVTLSVNLLPPII